MGATHGDGTVPGGGNGKTWRCYVYALVYLSGSGIKEL